MDDYLFDEIFGKKEEIIEEDPLFDFLSENYISKYTKRYYINDISKTCQILPSWRNEYDEIFKYY